MNLRLLDVNKKFIELRQKQLEGAKLLDLT